MAEHNAKYPPLARGPVCGGSCVYHGRCPSCELAMALQQSAYRFAPHFDVPIIHEVLGVPSEATILPVLRVKRKLDEGLKVLDRMRKWRTRLRTTYPS